MKNENKFLKIIVAILIILNLFISLKSLKLAIDYEALKIKNEDLEKVIEAKRNSCRQALLCTYCRSSKTMV